MRRFIEIKNVNDISWVVKELEQNFNLSDFVLPVEVLDEHRINVSVDGIGPGNNHISFEGRHDVIQKFLDVFHEDAMK